MTEVSSAHACVPPIIRAQSRSMLFISKCFFIISLIFVSYVVILFSLFLLVYAVKPGACYRCLPKRWGSLLMQRFE